MPSALLPSHDQTAFHVWPAAITPGIAVDVGIDGSGGAALVAGDAGCTGIANGCGGVLHFASTAGDSEFCQACWLLPRGKEDEGPCADNMATAQPRNTTTATRDFMIVTTRILPS